ncbi:transposase [Microcoleus sp. AR_TQ3_B6]|uniref:transposase n=1 Tax=Microcoleus sp. AR_TQ3_B6 TaxID=3055284 RepID=UPI002FD57110
MITTAELLEADRAQAIYLPPYSPEFNRIEKCSAWLKSRIRKQLHHSILCAMRQKPFLRQCPNVCGDGYIWQQI